MRSRVSRLVIYKKLKKLACSYHFLQGQMLKFMVLQVHLLHPLVVPGPLDPLSLLQLHSCKSWLLWLFILLFDLPPNRGLFLQFERLFRRNLNFFCDLFLNVPLFLPDNSVRLDFRLSLNCSWFLLNLLGRDHYVVKTKD